MRNQSLIAFDWNCARKELFPNSALRLIVYRSIRVDDRGGPTTYGERAFAVTLQKAGAKVYFVPTVCGATGNCTWRLYTINPRRFIGEIDGQYVYTYQSKHRLPIIVTYGNYSVSEGVLFTYVVTNGKYKRIRQQYPINVQNRNGHSMPTFLENATHRCKDYGL